MKSKNNLLRLTYYDPKKVYHAKDFTCPDCRKSVGSSSHKSVLGYARNLPVAKVIGYTNLDDGKSGYGIVLECPECFFKYGFHISFEGRHFKNKFIEDVMLHLIAEELIAFDSKAEEFPNFRLEENA